MIKEMDKDEIYDEKDEALLRLAFLEYAELDGLQIEEERKIYDERPSEENIAKLRKRLKEELSKMEKEAAQEKKAQPVPPTRARKVAARTVIIAAAVIVTASIVTFSVSAIREPFLNFFVNQSETGKTITMTQDPKNLQEDNSVVLAKSGFSIVGTALEGYEGNFVLTFVPDGYSLSNFETLKSACQITYSNASGQKILFRESYSSGNARVTLSGEDLENGKSTFVDGKEAALTEDERHIKLAWIKDDTLFSISSEDKSIDLIPIAEKVEKITK